MKAKKFLALFLVLFLVLALSSASAAASKKKSKKAAPAGDAITQILKKHKPENKTDAQTIRNILKKYGQNYVFIITLTENNWLNIEAVSSKNGASKGSAVLGIGEKYMDNLQPVWNIMKGASIFEYSGLALHFMKNENNYEIIRNDDLYDVEELDKFLDKNDLYVDDKFPFILKFQETNGL